MEWSSEYKKGADVLTKGSKHMFPVLYYFIFPSEKNYFFSGRNKDKTKAARKIRQN